MDNQQREGFRGDILVVDDHIPSLRSLTELLLGLGYQVRGARDGESALMMVKTEVPDLIILDIRMPGMDGFQVCQAVKSLPETTHIPVIFISGLNDVDDIVHGFEVGGADYIRKPFKVEEVEARLKTHLELSQLQQKLTLRNAELEREILHREQVQTALKAKEASLRAQYQSIPIPTYTWQVQDDDLVLVDFNESAVEITLGKIKDFIGASASQLYQDRPDILADLNRCAQDQGEPIEREIDYHFRSIKSKKYLSVKYAFVPTNQVLVHTEDITDRVQAEQELKNSQQFVQSSLDALSAHIAVIDMDGTILAVNDSWRIFADQNNLAWDQYGVGQNYLQAIDLGLAGTDSTPLEALRGIQEMIAGQRNYFSLEYPCHSPNRKSWFAMRVTRFDSNQGSRIVISHQDITDRRRAENELLENMHELSERVKELNCLYSFSAIIEQPGISLDEILQSTVDLLPSGWQYPEVACARIRLDNSQFTTKNFQETAWKQASNILVDRVVSGVVEVYYLEELPVAEEGAFLKAERSLINAIAERLGRVVQRYKAQEKIERRVDELSALNQIAHSMAITTDPINSLGLTAEVMTNLFSARTTIFLIPQKGSFDLQALAGFDRERGRFDNSNRRYPLNEMPLTNNLLVKGKNAFLSDVNNLDMPAVVREQVEALNLLKMLIVPLKSWGESVGLLVLGFDDPQQEINESEIALAETIASDVAGAIKNTRLAEQAQHAAVDAERQRLARELHDSATQSIYSLTLLSSGWESMARQGILEDPADCFQQLGEVGQQALREMRLLIHQLRPNVLQEAGLVEALQQRLDSVELRTNIEPTLVAKGNLDGLPTEIEDQLFNIAQEALNNSLRHAHASAVAVDIFEENDRVSLTIKDNGQGFETSIPSFGMGLNNMAERAKSIGGEFFIESELGRGTKVRIAVDINGKQEESR